MEKQLKNIEDPYKFAKDTAAAVRAKDWDAIDRTSLLDELESSIAGGLERDLHTCVRDILRARLSMKAKVDRSRNEDLLRNALENMRSLIRHSPSLRDLVTQEFVADAYKSARRIVSHVVQLPKRCPYSPDQLLKEAEAFHIEEL